MGQMGKERLPRRVAHVSLAVIAVLAMSCSKDLSRDRAAELIRRDFRPSTYSVQVFLGTKVPVPLSSVGAVATQIPFGSKGTNYLNGDTLAMGEYTRLAQAGLLKLQDVGGFVPMFLGDTTYYMILPTPAGDAVLNDGKGAVLGTGSAMAARLKMADIVFGEVTGIRQDDRKTRAEVEWTVVLARPTAAFKALGWNEAFVVRRSALFARFDDGWRLQQLR